MRPRLLVPILTLAVGATTVTALASPLTAGRPAASAAASRRAAELRELIGEASAQEAELLDQVADAQGRREDSAAALAALETALVETRGRLDQARARLSELDAQHASLSARIEDTDRRSGEARQRVNELVDGLYRRGERSDDALYAIVALRTTTPHDLFAASRYLSESARERREELSRLSGLRSLTASLRTQVETSRSDARSTRDAIGAESARLEQLRVEQARVQAEAVAEETRERALLEEVHRRKSDFARELALLEVESSSIGRLLLERQLGQVLAERRPGLLQMPVDGPVGNRRFGPQRHPILGTVRMHTGVDMRSPHGAPIRAAAPGEVVLAGPRGGYGNIVVLDHGNGLATLYAHQARVQVSIGDRVDAGAVVGLVGSTGLSTGPHLHFEVREFGTPVDPLFYL